MIVLDTHIWIWWVHGDEKPPANITSIFKHRNHKGWESVQSLAGKLPSWLNSQGISFKGDREKPKLLKRKKSLSDRPAHNARKMRSHHGSMLMQKSLKRSTRFKQSHESRHLVQMAYPNRDRFSGSLNRKC